MKNKPFWYHSKTGRFFDNKDEIPDSLIDDTGYWDSILEFNVYSHLLKITSKENIKRQHVIELLPKTKLFPKWTWNVDFCVEFEGKQFLIEAKGKWILYDELNRKAFVQTLRLLSESKPELFQSLILVDSDSWLIPGTRIPVCKLDNLAELMRKND